MSARILPLLLRRAQSPEPSGPQAEPLDYCECNRGPVIGTVIAYADRLLFFPLSNKKAEYADNVAYLRCVDCLADISMDVANGVIKERMRELSRQRASEIDALMRQNAMRKDAGLPIVPAIVPEGNDWPTTDFPAGMAQGQTSPSKGDQVT